MRKTYFVTFLPMGETVTGHRGDTLLDVALENGIDMPHECGGNCSCTTCRVVVESGAEYLSMMQGPEDERLNTARERTEQSRLGCQALLLGGPVTARICGEAEESWDSIR